MTSKSTGFRLAYGVLVVLFLIRFLPFVVGTKWLWGVSYLTLLSPVHAIGYGILGAVALIIPLLSRSERWGESITAWFSRTFYESDRKYLFRALVLLVGAVLFIWFRTPTHFLGDGYTLLANAASSAGHWVKWSERGAYIAIVWLRGLLGPPSPDTALQAYQIVSVISGLLALWFYFLIARAVSPDRTKRFLTFVTLTFSPTLLLFFGYVESYPILWGPLAGFLYFSMTYARSGKGIVAALIFLLVATALHLQVVMFLPAVGFLLFSRGLGRRIYDRFRFVIWILLGLLLAAGGTMFVFRLETDLAFQNIFLPLFAGKPGAPDYAIISRQHLADIANLLLLVYSATLLFLALGIEKRQNVLSDRLSTYLILLSLGSLLFALVIDPGLSMPRDWDLFSLCWLAPMLLVLHLVRERRSGLLKRLTVPITVLSILTAGSFLLVNLNRERTVAYVKQIITNDPDKSFGTISILGKQFSEAGDTRSADSLESLRHQWYPDFFRLKRVFTALNAWDVAGAEKELQGVTPDRYSKDYQQVLAELYIRKQQLDSALVHAQAAVQLQPYYEQGYITLCSIHYLLRQYDDAVAAAHGGLLLNRASASLTAGLSVNFVAKRQFDSAVFYGTRALALDSNEMQAYICLSQAHLALGRRDMARQYARNYLRRERTSAEYSFNRRELLRVFPELDPGTITAPDSSINTASP